MKGAVCVVATCLALYAVPPASAFPPLRDFAVIWLFLVDDLHIDFRTTGIVRTWLASLSKELIRDDDVFAARSTGPSSLSVGLLAAPEDLQAGIRRLSGAALKAEEVLKSPEGVDEVFYRAKVAMRTATEFLSTAPQHDPRRKVMLYIGKGFDTSDPLSDETQTLLTEAWRLHVTLIALDPSALPRARAPVPYLADAERMRRLNAARATLERLALPTQGFVLADEEALRNAAVRISNAVR